MRGIMNVIIRLARTMNERLDAVTEVETRVEGEIPEFHPDDRLVQACAEDVELEEHVPEYASVPESGQSVRPGFPAFRPVSWMTGH
ncbi:hypothetical protein Taro_024864 [Colocasia esculenta]|uniref:Uncharacterized protein n=1 Tax=Colocasia esculenta TaxID=4460 RepID=A0A843V7E0_COLES|nr:hypothetical protein [Colocasia esculenta]